MQRRGRRVGAVAGAVHETSRRSCFPFLFPFLYIDKHTNSLCFKKTQGLFPCHSPLARAPHCDLQACAWPHSPTWSLFPQGATLQGTSPGPVWPALSLLKLAWSRTGVDQAAVFTPYLHYIQTQTPLLLQTSPLGKLRLCLISSATSMRRTPGL